MTSVPNKLAALCLQPRVEGNFIDAKWRGNNIRITNKRDEAVYLQVYGAEHTTLSKVGAKISAHDVGVEGSAEYQVRPMASLLPQDDRTSGYLKVIVQHPGL